VTTRDTADALIIGGGLIGLAAAAALERRGITAIILDDARDGLASPAAAGMLAPGVDRPDTPGHAAATAARALYPEYLAWLRARTGIAVPLNTNGILQVAVTPAGVRGLRRAMPPTAAWLDAATVGALEPELAGALGAVHHPHDGAVDNVILLEALRTFCGAGASVRLERATVQTVALRSDGVSLRTTAARTFSGRHVVLAAGAWANTIGGLPRHVPVTPLRGQMLAFPPVKLRHVLFGPRGYIIPREFGDAGSPSPLLGEILVGATSEEVGYDSGTTTAGATKLRTAAEEIIPAFGALTPRRHWAGLRPMTPDLLPIIGSDAQAPALLYACGHSRNGVLFAPLTGDIIGALIAGEDPPVDITPFRVTRFAPAQV
jgi:glycine oxidase